jgi:uncharacterized protein
LASNPAACASLSHALSEFLTPPSLVIIRGEAKLMADWRDAIQQHYFPHHLVFYLDETIENSKQDLPPTLQRKLTQDVNAWVCQGVVCSASLNSLQSLLQNLAL